MSLMILGCAGGEAPSPTLADSPVPEGLEIPVAMMTGPSCGISGTSYLRKCWATDVVIEVATSSTDATIQQHLEAGVNRWNTLLSAAPVSYRRVFSWNGTTTSGADAVVHVHGPVGATFCGNVNPSTFVIDLYVLGAAQCPVGLSFTGDIPTVLAHELASVIGWEDGVENLGIAGVSNEYCVSTFPDRFSPGPLSTNICYHDVNGVMRLYKLGSVDLGGAYWSTKILSQTDVGLAAATVDSGQTVAITANGLSAGPHAQYGDVVGYGPSSYSSTILPSGFATRVGNSIRGDQVGAVTVKLLPTNAPSGYDLWEPLATEGRTVELQVNEVPSVPFKVVQITPDTGGISVPGWHTFTAHVVSAPGTPVSTRWIVVDSRTPTVADTIWRYGHTTLGVLIPSGESYTLSLTARPHYHHVIGLSATQDIPICTGEALLGGGSGKNESTKTPPPTTNAIPGCGDPGGGEW